MSFNDTAVKKEDTYALIMRARAGDRGAREQIIERNTGLVKSISLKFSGTSYELEDLTQIGFIGLIKAIDRFDTSFNVMFSTYAVPMILGEIKRHMRDDGKIKMSRGLKTDINKMRRHQDEYYHKNGRHPKLSELAKLMEITTDRLMEVMEASGVAANLESLDDPIGAEAREASPCAYTEAEDKTVDMIQLKTVIGKLAERERQIIVLRYFKDMTQQQIAEKIGISQVQVSRIEKKVLENIRREFSG